MRDEIKKIQLVIKSYLEQYYEILGTGVYNIYQFKDYFAYSLRGNRAFIKEEILLKMQIEHCKKQHINLLFHKPMMDISWRYIGGSGNRCEVRLSLTLEIQYQGIPVPTSLKNVEHNLVLAKEGRNWKIEEDDYACDFTLPYIQNKEENFFRKRKKKWELRELEEKPKPKGKYDRNKAVAYAKKYALTPNTKEWKNYEAYGGDCTNFISQCLFAGGIPFDHDGKYVTEKWYWYSDNYRTPSFTSADALKDYMMINEGFGLVARLGDLQTMKLGDIVQLGDLKDTTHSMLVVGIIQDDINPDMTKDLLIAQHSGVNGIRGYNIPLSTKPNTRLYYNILGYNP